MRQRREGVGSVALDCCGREIMSSVTITQGIDAGFSEDFMVQAVENRLALESHPSPLHQRQIIAPKPKSRCMVS